MGVFNKVNIGSRDTYCTVTNLNDDSRDAYETGEYVPSTASTVSFWGEVKDLRTLTDYVDNKALEKRGVSIECDTRDVTTVTNGSELRLDTSAIIYTVDDVYESDFRYTSMVIAYEIMN